MTAAALQIAGQTTASTTTAPSPTPPLPPTTTTTAPSATCPPTATITALVPSSTGLLIRVTAPVAAALTVASQPAGEFVSVPPMLTVDLPNTELAGIESRVEWAGGPIESMRATRYRTAHDCGIRMRLQPRVSGTWRIAPESKGIMVTLATVTTAEGVEALVTPHETPPGAVAISTSVSESRGTEAGTPSALTGVVAAGFAQSLPKGGTLRGFLSEVRPRTVGAPFGAIGVATLPAGPVSLNAAAGDIYVNLGETGDNDLTNITTSLFRGAGLGVRFSDALAMQLFGGRAASSSLLRAGIESTFAPPSHDHIFGGQVSWVPLGSDFAAAAGALHTEAPDGGPRTLNVFQAGEYRRSKVLRIRLVTEESHAFDTHADGFAYTIQSRVLTRILTLDGFYRALSSHFRPAGGAGFYASLRRSYGLSGAVQREHLSISAAFSQSKVFDILDPESVGSLTATRDLSIAYALSPHLSLQGSYGQSSIRTDPGATIPADSRTRQAGAGFGFAVGKIDGSAQYVDSTTQNGIDPDFDLRSRRLDADLFSAYGRDIYGRFSFAHSERPNGAFAGSDYRGSIGVPLFETHGWSVAEEMGIDVAPAGVAQTAFRRTYATLRINPTRSSWISGAMQFTYERVRTEQEAFHVFVVSLNTQQLTRWGAGMVIPQYETRALFLTEPRPARPAGAIIRVIVFEDRNRNGKRDPDEPPVTPAFIEIGDRRYRTDASGEVEAHVAPGRYGVRLLPRGAPIGDFIPEVSVSVEVATGETAQATFALQPAGKLPGRVEAQAAVDSRLLAGLFIHATGPVERQVFTDANGAFDFGLLPEGDYNVALNLEQLRDRGLAAVPPATVTVTVRRGSPAEVTLRVRRLTARERFGI